MEKPNINYIQELSGGDVEFEQKILTILKTELPEEIAHYKKAIKNQNFKESAQSVHKLKHKISILGLENAYRFAEQYEKELNSGIAAQHPSFLKILESMSQFLAKN
ncbi:Hpt domain-containing protein [Tenacibaculum sp. IB213877]|uniref:Hpt domain-containing protein n=1 Tax=Tenacibaculum sp. IB213877 TaxID=3097351 RepID=UPI002A5AA5B8|nr:Hpt domain-containing protein [Tenacibaculum sp. IB213877]MDY0781508.1 Hpt domain-containing protein [Tenacibaculum sp. IB213877]